MRDTEIAILKCQEGRSTNTRSWHPFWACSARRPLSVKPLSAMMPLSVMVRIKTHRSHGSWRALRLIDPLSVLMQPLSVVMSIMPLSVMIKPLSVIMQMFTLRPVASFDVAVPVSVMSLSVMPLSVITVSVMMKPLSSLLYMKTHRLYMYPLLALLSFMACMKTNRCRNSWMHPLSARVCMFTHRLYMKTHRFITRINSPPPGSQVFQQTGTIFFHDDWKINVTWRVKNAPPSGRNVFQPAASFFKLVQDIETTLLTKFHEDRTMNVASRVFTMKNAPPSGSNIIKTNLLTKFNEDRTTNVASRVKKCPAPWRPCFSPNRSKF
ncbi:hypothetical protein DPMN_092497 [Dreissena polymorpha]|uniref:Uncharacterized protein n=1 Tax=Dreissena polymorpha TaxID=45954 RepID=A0A9D4L414_DREPO|nr:hypothetical protein DPMN_092497 [Dreissena polymorpha]